MENLITAYDLDTNWLEMEDFTEWAIDGKSKKKNQDGSTYRILVTAIRNPINIHEAADLCSDEHLVEFWV